MVEDKSGAASGQHRLSPSQQQEVGAAQAVLIFSKGHSAAVRTKPGVFTASLPHNSGIGRPERSCFSEE